MAPALASTLAVLLLALLPTARALLLPAAVPRRAAARRAATRLFSATPSEEHDADVLEKSLGAGMVSSAPAYGAADAAADAAPAAAADSGSDEFWETRPKLAGSKAYERRVTDAWAFQQDAESVHVYIDLPPDWASKRSIAVEIGGRELSVAIDSKEGGEAAIAFKGPLLHRVLRSDSFWYIERLDDRAGVEVPPFVAVELAKKVEFQQWDGLFAEEAGDA